MTAFWDPDEPVPPPPGTLPDRPDRDVTDWPDDQPGDPAQAEAVQQQARQARLRQLAEQHRLTLEARELAQQQIEQAKAEQLHQGPPPPPYLDWDTLLSTDFGATPWITDPLLGPGEQISLIGSGGVGKSLLAWEWACRLANGTAFLNSGPTAPIRVGYVDLENPQAEIQKRCRTTGFDKPAMLENLRYASYPRFGPLDTPIGASSLLAWVQEVQPEVLFLDTISRMIAGGENDADTWLQLYRLTFLPLRSLGVAVVRLDHYGKDTARGSRGSSAKSQDVDQEWAMTQAPGHDRSLFVLRRTKTRTGLGQGSLTIRRHGRPDELGTTAHMVAEPPSQVETQQWLQLVELARLLDLGGLPANAGRNRAQQYLQSIGRSVRNETLAEVVRMRQAGEHLETEGVDDQWEQSGIIEVDPRTNR